ncbi:MAG: hypothetical protein KatS3mg068_1230 [Candidatus Sericytochromatia bacterium]|nr:MAG: hypothetical protein KatS3mg068_1230 [Candidatus Sericytochromatia bacterium]
MLKKIIIGSLLLSLNACVFTATGSITPVNKNDQQGSSNSTTNSETNSNEQSKLKDIPVKEVQAIPDQLVMVEGNKLKGSASVIYTDNSRNSDIVWSSSDNTIASVNPTTGEISALKAGVVTIIATAQRDTSKKSFNNCNSKTS